MRSRDIGIVSQEIGAPMQPELAIGAVVDGDAPEVVRNERLIRELGISEDEFIEEHSGSSRSSRHAASYGSQDAPAFP
jgi:predicted phosphoribosyltransferase